jgi:hypothetical protein
VPFQKRPEFILERPLAVVLLLPGEVLLDGVQAR